MKHVLATEGKWVLWGEHPPRRVRPAHVTTLTGPPTEVVYSSPSEMYVDKNATGPHNGMSWCNAYTERHAASNAARPGTTIRVAGGVYTPSVT